MANVNRVILIGRLTRDPEAIGSGKGCKFGLAMNDRKLNPQTQQWEDVPIFIDCEMWNRGETGTQATRLLETVRKGQQIFLEGKLKYDTWNDPPEKGGGKRSALRVVVENFQYLEPRQDGKGQQRQGGGRQAPAGAGGRGAGFGDVMPNEDDIPF